MPQFYDTKGRAWQVAISVDTVRRVRDACKFDLLAVLSDQQQLRRLTDDPVLFVDVLFVVCADQCQSLSVSDREFGQSLGGDSLPNALDAFTDALIDFFPQARRNLLTAVWARIRAQREAATTAIASRVKPELIDNLAKEALAEALAEVDSRLAQLTSGKPSTT